jgi:hypothetical protein
MEVDRRLGMNQMLFLHEDAAADNGDSYRHFEGILRLYV